jgi:hypothetical protein
MSGYLTGWRDFPPILFSIRSDRPSSRLRTCDNICVMAILAGMVVITFNPIQWLILKKVLFILKPAMECANSYLATGAEVSPAPPRLSSPPITGWCSWYNLDAYINEENILDHLHAAQAVAERENLPMRVFQIDDGFTPEIGDWLEVKIFNCQCTLLFANLVAVGPTTCQ